MVSWLYIVFDNPLNADSLIYLLAYSTFLFYFYFLREPGKRFYLKSKGTKSKLVKTKSFLSALLDGEISILVAFATKIVKQHP